MPHPTSVLVVIVALCVPLAATPGAWALRYASPSGKSTNDCKTPATACDLATAIHGAGGNSPEPGEEVVVEPGNYNVLSTIETGAAAMNVHGASGKPRPVITGNISQLLRTEKTGTFSYLDIEEQGTEMALFSGGGTLERLLVRGKPSGEMLCQCYGGTIRDSVFVALPGSSGGAVGIASSNGFGTETLRNDTIYSEAVAAPAIRLLHSGTTGELVINAYNTIAVNSAGGNDVSASEKAAIVMKHSDYTSPTGTVTDLGGHVNAPPLFAKAAMGEFGELAGSPTIDAGLNEAENGTLDYAGNPRVVGTATDIGAFEYQPPASEPPKLGVPKLPPPVVQVISPVTLKLSLGSTKVAINSKTGQGTLTVTCQAPAGQRCTVSGSLYAAAAVLTTSAKAKNGKAKPRKVGSISGSVAAGSSGKLTVKLTKAALRALKRHHSFGTTLSAAVGDQSERATLRGALHLRLRSARH